MMRRSVLILFLMFFVLATSVEAQNRPNVENKKKFISHVRIGGGLGLSFGNGFFGGTLAPSAIYDFNDQLSAGVGFNATYNKLKHQYSSTIIGASVIGLYSVIPQLQLSTEFEELHVSRKFDSSLGLKNNDYWYPALFLGAGYLQGNFTVGIKYDVLYDRNKSIYADAYLPFIRVYF